MHTDEYTVTIGLEIHAELKTQTKMFCDCKNDPDEKSPNANICPICMGHPGTLPVINKKAVEHVLRVGVALGGTLATFSEFDRKNYFYPDIPKGYQISQYAYPLVKGGTLRGIEITRIHLEEDTARSSHDSGEYSLVDFNRAGVPLMELVTEPVLHSGEEAALFAEELQLLLRTLGVAHANMEKGEMRVEANISVSKTKTFGTKVEVKNLNSFKAVERAIAFETKRQIEVLESGGAIVQETRGYDENTSSTFSQRLKESSHDYRYFPDPDLPKLQIDQIAEFSFAQLQKSTPLLPDKKRKLYSELTLKSEDIEMLIRDYALAQYTDSVLEILTDNEVQKIAVNYITSDIAGARKLHGDHIFSLISPQHLASLATLLQTGVLTSKAAKNIIAVIIGGENGSIKEIAERHDFLQKDDPLYISSVVDKILSENGKAFEEFRAGKKASLQFLIGQGMRLSKGSINPALLEKEIESRLQKIG